MGGGKSWGESENLKADDASSNSYTGTTFDFTATGTITDDNSTATAEDDNTLTFTKGWLPNGGSSASGNNYTFTAKKDITSLKIYYTLSDSKFSSKDQSKGGSFKYKIGDAEEVTLTAVTGSNAVAYAATISDISNGDVITIYSSANRLVIFGVYATYASASVAPTITTNLSSTADVTVGIAQTFSIVATDATSYQWYVNNSVVDGATSASYTYTAASAGDVEIYCNAINTVGATKSTVCTVTATMPASAPTITTDINAAYSVIKGNTQILTIEAEGAASYQWYMDAVAIDGATSASYTYTAGSTIGVTNQIYCAVTNATGTTNSTEATMTVVGSDACKLNQVIYSNTFDAFILEPTTESNGKVKAYYLAGTTKPTISSYQISEDASYSIEGDMITVTAEDGVTTAKYDITVEAVTPYDGAGLTFDGEESWVKTGNAFSTSSGKVGWVISRNAKNDGEAWERESPGKNRIYLFLAPSKSFSFTNGGTKRAVKVYVNGTEKLSEETDALTNIAGDEDNAYMVAIVSNQTSGDGAIKSISISKSVSVPIGDTGWSTYSSAYALDFENAEDGIEAYMITGFSGTTLTTSKVTGTVPANTGLLVKGAASTSYAVPVVASSSTDVSDNKLVASVAGGTVSAGTDPVVNYVLINNSGTAEFQWIGSTSAILGANKAYLSLSGGTKTGAGSRGLAIDIDIDGVSTGINMVNGEGLKVNGSETYYDLQGHRVLYPTKGLYIVNGKKVVIK